MYNYDLLIYAIIAISFILVAIVSIALLLEYKLNQWSDDSRIDTTEL